MKKTELICPLLDERLLRWLDQQFPERAPDKRETLDDLRWRGGERNVVRRLWDEFDRQQEGSMDVYSQT